MSKDKIITTTFLAFLIIFTSVDIFTDIREGLELSHLLHELIILLSSLGIVGYKVFIIISKDKQISDYRKNSLEANREINFYKNKINKYKQEMSQIINSQFKIWGLTDSEKDIALLLIKGLSMKEISALRGSSDATVRQQSASVYKKSKLDNRNQLSSYFLEDLF